MTKRELAAEALALGRALGVEVDVARKNHTELTALVEDLQRRAQSAQVGAGAGAAEPGAASTTEPGAAEPGAASAARLPEVQFDGISMGRSVGVRRTTASPRPAEASSPLSDASAPAAPSREGNARPTSAARVTSYRVAPSKVLTTLSGYLQEGDRVAAADLAGGQGTIDLLLGKGVVEPR